MQILLYELEDDDNDENHGKINQNGVAWIICCEFSSTLLVIIDYPFLLYPAMIIIVTTIIKST